MQYESNTINFFSQEELIRYSRHFSLGQIGLEGQRILKQARVLCIGAGGLGSPLLLYLAAAGVGTLGIVDDDLIELSNIHRQILYSSNELGLNKSNVAQTKLKSINPNVEINAHNVRITQENILDIMKNYDLVADGTDNFSTRYLVNDACFHLKKVNVYASIFQFEGQCSVFTADHGPCYRCLFPEQPSPQFIPNCAEGGVLGVLPGIMGLIQATEVIKQILKIGEPLTGRLLTFDALAMAFREFKIHHNPKCPLCQGMMQFGDFSYNSSECQISKKYIDVLTPIGIFSQNKIPDEFTDELTPQNLYHLIENKKELCLIDVREPYEREICHLAGLFIPLGNLPHRIQELNRNQQIVVYCKSGIRGRKAVNILREAGFPSVFNLAGGILAWRKEIDPNMKIY